MGSITRYSHGIGGIGGYECRNFRTCCRNISVLIKGILLYEYAAMMKNGSGQSMYMHKAFPTCDLVAGMEPCSKMGSVFFILFTLTTPGMQGIVWYRYSLAGHTKTLQSVDKVSHTVTTLHFITKALMGTKEDLI